MEHQKEGMEIDLLGLFFYLKKRLLAICAVAVVCAVVSFLVTSLCIPPKYTANTRIYVLNRQSEKALVSSDYLVSNYMISDYTILITGRNVTSEVIADLGLDMSASELAGMIKVSSPNNTRVLQVSVTDTDPQRAADIANAVRETASVQIKNIMDVDAVNLVYEAEAPRQPSAPSVFKNVILSAIAGLFVMVSIFTVIFILDDAIRTEEDVEKHLGLGVMGVIPLSAELKTTQSKKSKKKKLGTFRTEKKK